MPGLDFGAEAGDDFGLFRRQIGFLMRIPGDIEEPDRGLVRLSSRLRQTQYHRLYGVDHVH